jgi:ubiquinone/menaquinone biosynthesis C-methylase UbiE
MGLKPDIVAFNAFETDRLVQFYAAHESSYPAEQAILTMIGAGIAQMKVLDIGIGAGRTTGYLSKICKDYTGIDFSGQMVKEAKKRFSDLKIFQGDVRDLSAFADGSFDFVLFSFNGIDTLVQADRMKALQEIKRVLKPGGYFAFSSHNLGWTMFDKLFPWHQKFVFSIPFIKHYLKMIIYLPWITARRKNNLYAEDYAIILDRPNWFSFYNYFIKPADQAKQLNETGFENMICLNDKGQVVCEDKTAEFLYYFCRKPQ